MTNCLSCNYNKEPICNCEKWVGVRGETGFVARLTIARALIGRIWHDFQSQLDGNGFTLAARPPATVVDCLLLKLLFCLIGRSVSGLQFK